MKLIPLEEVEKIIQGKLVYTDGWNYLKNQNKRYKEILSEIDSLPTIDPIATIDEMIEEKLDYACNHPGDDVQYQIDFLEELKSRLLLTQK